MKKTVLNNHNVISSGEFKLKDKEGKNSRIIDLSALPFPPELIFIEKVKAKNNTFRVICVRNSKSKDKKDGKPRTESGVQEKA